MNIIVRLSFILIILFLLTSCSNDDDGGNVMTNAEVFSTVQQSSTPLSATMSLSDVLASNATIVNVNDQTIFAAGHRQVGQNNQDPILMRFDNGSLTWARDDYDTTGDDGNCRGIIFDPSSNRMHVVFTATGTQGNSQNDYRDFTTNGWLINYGQGGGPRVVVLAQINPENGDPISGTYVYAKLSNGDTNTLAATSLDYQGDTIVMGALSFFSPLKVDKSTFTCTGSSPFDYSISFDLGLTEALSASSNDCTD